MDAVIKELLEEITSLTSGFENMLKEVLENMKLRIQEANDAWKEENDTKLMEKFKEIVDNGTI